MNGSEDDLDKEIAHLENQINQIEEDELDLQNVIDEIQADMAEFKNTDEYKDNAYIHLHDVMDACGFDRTQGYHICDQKEMKVLEDEEI